MSINLNTMPNNSGIKFQPQNKINQNLNPNNSNLDLSGFDEFTKSTNTNKNINFTSFFNSKPLSRLGSPTTEAQILELRDALAEKGGAVWTVMEFDPKYFRYFQNIKIDKPQIELLKQVNPPSEYKDGNISRYNWATNTISLNISYLPNMALISKGNIALVPQDVAPGFIKNTPKDRGSSQINDYEDLGNKSIGFAIQSSMESGKNYYYKLSPKETAELATQYLAQEMDRLFAFHALINTENVGGDYGLIDRYYDELKDAKKLQHNTTGFWVDTYPGEYKRCDEVTETYPVYKYNGPDRWSITGDTPYSIPSITHKELWEDFIATDNLMDHPKSLLELSNLIAAQRFMENYTPRYKNEREKERLEILYQIQQNMLDLDIKEKIKNIKG